MKSKLLLATLVVLTSAASASAASLGYRQNGNAFSLYVNGQATVFDAIQVDATPVSGASFTNIVSGQVAGVPLRAGHPATYRNRALTLDPQDGGRGYLEAPPMINSNLFSWGFTAPGSSINTAAENSLGYLFLANLNLSIPSTYPTRTFSLTVTLVNQGNTVQTLGAFLLNQSELPPVPEPASSVLAGLALAALASMRRRSQ